VPIRKRKLTTEQVLEARLRFEQVLEARLRFTSGEREWGRFSKDYGVSREAIKSAVLGLTFKELPMPPKTSLSLRPFRYG
jgi:hypothetical protein